MNGYERRKQHKRDQILRAAIELFRAQGFRKTSVQEIAVKAGVSQVTIYNHFNDKQNLMAEAIRLLTHETIERFQHIMESNEPWPKRLEMMILDKHKAIRDFRGEFVETLYREMPDLVSELRKAQIEAREAITYTFLDEGRSLGYVPDTISNQSIEIFFETISRGFDSSPENTAKLSEKPELFDEFFDLILHGFVRDRGTER